MTANHPMWCDAPHGHAGHGGGLHRGRSVELLARPLRVSVRAWSWTLGQMADMAVRP
jgi:hypothetical protein